MIKEEKCFVLKCDNCNSTYCDDHRTGFSMFTDEETPEYYAQQDGWYAKGEKHYCPKCHEIKNGKLKLINQTT